MRRLLIGLGIGSVAIVLASGLGRLPVFENQELDTYDRRLAATARPADARDDIVIIEINESSMNALEPIVGRWPWPRAIHAGVIDFLAKAGARVIAYDVLFIERDLRSGFSMGSTTMTGAESDAALVTSVARAGNVVLAAEALYEGLLTVAAAPNVHLPGVTYRPGPGFQVRPHLNLPFATLAAVSAGVGHTVLVKDADGTARRVLPFIEAAGQPVPWLGLAALLAAERVPPSGVVMEGGRLRLGSTSVPLLDAVVPPREGEAPQPSRQMVLRFRGPYADLKGATTYRSYSFVDVLASEDRLASGQAPLIDPADFRGKLVFIGTTAAGLGDVSTTPFEQGAGTPGVYLHAAAADDVLSQRFLRRAGPSTDYAVTTGVGLAAGVVSAVLPVGWAVAAVVMLAAGLVTALTVAVGQGVWIALVTPMIAVALATFGGTAWQYFVEGAKKRQMKQLFGRYVSPDVFAHLVADPSMATLGGQRREMSVLFSDIRGFTTAAERETPEAIVAQLNEYFTAMVEVLFRHQGTLDKFVGDMVMGLFGAPVEDPRHADHAVAAALDMVAALDRLNAQWKKDGRPAMDIGIGINSGAMIAGNIGSATIMSYTVIGDAVNLGARLESLNKEYGTRILISEATRSQLTIAVKTRDIGPLTVKGKTQAVGVHEVICS